MVAGDAREDEVEGRGEGRPERGVRFGAVAGTEGREGSSGVENSEAVAGGD